MRHAIMSPISTLSLLAATVGLAQARYNQGVGKLPVMGYDTYNAFNGTDTLAIFTMSS